MSKSSGKWIAAGIVVVAVIAAAAFVFMAGRKPDTEVMGLIRQAPPEAAKPITDNAFDEQGRLRTKAGGAPGEDSMIPWSFVSDLSDFMLDHYQPAGTRQNPTDKAVFTLGYKQLNMRYGLEVSHFAHDSPDVPGARKQVFDYVFRPGVLTALHTLYAESFVQDVAQKAALAEREFQRPDGGFETRTLNGREAAEGLGLMAGFLRDAGRVLRAMGANERIMAMLPEYEEASRQVNLAYSEFNDLRESGGKGLAQAGERIKKAIERREALRQAVVGAVRRDAGRLALQQDAIFYLVQWGARRVAADETRRGSLSVAGKLLDDLANKLNAAAAQGQMGGGNA